MLVFDFRKEIVGDEVILRPRLTVHLTTDRSIVATAALLDSGADRTIVPDFVADVLELQKGTPVKTSGIGGVTNGFESVVDITFVDSSQNKEIVEEVPVYILKGVSDVVIGRRKIFDFFRITFEQFNNKIMLEKK